MQTRRRIFPYMEVHFTSKTMISCSCSPCLRGAGCRPLAPFLLFAAMITQIHLQHPLRILFERPPRCTRARSCGVFLRHRRSSCHLSSSQTPYCLSKCSDMCSLSVLRCLRPCFPLPCSSSRGQPLMSASFCASDQLLKTHTPSVNSNS